MAEPSDKVALAAPQPHVAVVTINRPEARNAIDAETARALENVIDRTENDADVWAVVLTGSGGKVFSAGADLKEVDRGNLQQLYTERGGFAGFVQAQRTKPWIAAVDGLAFAGGCEIALACDLIVASEDGAFALPEVKRGLLAAAGGVYRLVRSLPRAIAHEMILTGERVPATRLAELGMINRVAPSGRVVETAIALAQQITANAPLATRESMMIARQAFDLADRDLQRLSDEAQARLSKTEDFGEGPRAFIEKREPRWLGR